jgi:hypothetical protein
MDGAEASMGSSRAADGMILFDSIHFVLAAEKLLKARGVWIDIVPIPKALSADCGMGIAFRREDLGMVREILTGGHCRMRAIHVRTADGYEEVDE